VLYKSHSSTKQRHTAILKGMGFAAMMGIMSIMIHSSTDFNLQIPANACYLPYCVLLLVSHSMEQQEHRSKRKAKLS
jgi:putative inorganic carbon (HCO3(-)) transporter